MLRKVMQNKTRLILKACASKNYRNHFANVSTVDNSEKEHFKELAAKWWDDNNPIKPLHSMNKIRVPFICNSITQGGVDNSDLGRKELLKSIKLLDVGCGGGVLSEPLGKLGINTTGIDVAEELINVAKYHASKTQGLENLSYVCTTVEEFSEKHKSHFDAVVASEVVEHVSDVEYFLGECIKCLKPGGSMIITTINKTFAANMYAIKFLEYIKSIPPGTHQYEKLVPPSVLQAVLEKNSCRTVRIQGTFYNWMTNKWSFTTGASIFYMLHAIKK